jgi:uncharacterized protein YkwD
MRRFVQKQTLWKVFLLLVASRLFLPTSILAESVGQSNSNELIVAVNSLRVANGLPPYNPHPILMKIAQAHADYMAASGSVTHYGPGGERPFQRALNAGYPVAGDLSLGGFFSENILAGRFAPERAVQIWQGDAPHLNTMLSPNLKDIGAGVTKVGDFIYYVIDAGLVSNAPTKFTPSVPIGTPDEPGISQFIVPVVTSTADETGLVYHEVQSGQSLWAIAIAYGTKIDEIRRLNKLQTGAPIFPGDRLLVRKGVVPTHTEKIEAATSTISPTVVITQESPSIPAPSTETFQPTSQPLDNSGTSSSIGVMLGIILVTMTVAGLLTWVLANKSSQ